MTITISASFHVDEDNVSEFASFLRDVTTMVREREQGQTLVYQFLAQESENNRYRVVEVYSNAAALRQHLVNLSEYAEVGARVMKFEELVLTGDIPEEITAQMKSLGITKLTHYPHVVASP